MVMFLDEARVAELLSWERLIPTMEQALAEFSQGRVLQPVRQMLTIEAEERYLGIMPAVAEEAMGLKLVSFYPKNAGTAVSAAATKYLAPPEAQVLALLGSGVQAQAHLEALTHLHRYDEIRV